MKLLQILGITVLGVISLAGAAGAGYLYLKGQSSEKVFVTKIKELEDKITGLEKVKLQSSTNEVEALAKNVKATQSSLEDATLRFKQEVGRIAEVDAKAAKALQEASALKQTTDLNKQSIQDLKTASNLQGSSIKELEERYSSLSDRLTTQLPLEDQGNYLLVGKKRFEALPSERRVLLSAFSSLPLDKKDISVNIPATQKEVTDVSTLDKVKQEFLKRAQAGEDVHLIVGRALPIERLVWLERYEAETFDIVHPSLEHNLWSKVAERTQIPAVFKTGEFGLYYNKAGRLTVYQLTN
jgi:hypothetical protein